ncbi:MAG: translational machinery protein [Polyangiaceae bacterium]
MKHRHAAVWLDHNEAKIYQVEPKGFELSKVSAPHHHVKKKADEQGKHAGQQVFFGDIATQLKDSEELLIVGPSSAKLDFIRYLHKHEHELEARVLGVETLDHPTDGQLVAYVRHYFKAVDQHPAATG